MLGFHNGWESTQWLRSSSGTKSSWLKNPPPPRKEFANVVELVRGILEEAQGLLVVCDDTQFTCTGACCGPVCKAMGVVLVRPGTGSSMAFIEPSGVTPEWTLKLGSPLLSPHSNAGYVGAIFTAVLKNGLPFSATWGSQILSAAAWLNVAMLSGYGRGEAMRAMHKGVYRAYTTAPHDVQATVKAVYSLSYHLPTSRARRLVGSVNMRTGVGWSILVGTWRLISQFRG